MFTMASFHSKEVVCKLCREVILNKDFEIINDSIKDIFDNLLLKLKFEEGCKDLVCSYCQEKLNAALDFKSTCLNTDNTIIPYVNCKKMLQLDLREVYMMEKESGQLMSISEDQKVCRLCMQLVRNDFRYIHEEEMASIQKFVPEMNMNIIKNPIVCNQCFDSLSTHNHFIKKCFHIDEKIGQIFDVSTTECKTNVELSLDLFVKTECLGTELEINDMEMSLKAEPIEIKTEENEEESNTFLSGLNEQEAENSNYKVAKNARDVCEVKHENASEKCDQSDFNSKWKGKASKECSNGKYTSKSKSHFTIHSTKLKDNTKVYKCDMCDYKTKRQYLLGKHQLKHEKCLEVQMFKCNECNFKSKCKRILISHKLKHKELLQIQTTSEATHKSDTFSNDSEHVDDKIDGRNNKNVYRLKTECKGNFLTYQLVHKDFSEVSEYKCDTCDYRSKLKGMLVRHQLKHKKCSEAQIYKCDICDYKTKIKSNFVRHQLKHKDFTEVPIYKCDVCDYKTKYKSTLTCHQLKHKDFSEVQIYKCDICDYKTKYKKHYTNHQLVHKDFSEENVYMCDTCDFRAKDKYVLIKHQLKHKDVPEEQTYMCDTCDYITKRKDNLVSHQLKHKDLSEVQMYKCYTCDFRTKFKASLVRHQLKHKDLLKVQIYKCDACDYRTKFKENLLSHQLIHKDDSEVEIYKCYSCNFITKFKGSLVRHQLKHKDFLEVQKYKCDACDYRTKFKENLLSHQLTCH